MKNQAIPLSKRIKLIEGAEMRNKLVLMFVVMNLFYIVANATDIDFKIGTVQLMLGGRTGVELGLGHEKKESVFVEGGAYLFVPVSMGKYFEVKTGINKSSSLKIGVQLREGKDISSLFGRANKMEEGYYGNSTNDDRILQAGPVIEYSKRDGLIYIALSMLRSVKEKDEFLNGYLDIGVKFF